MAKKTSRQIASEALLSAIEEIENTSEWQSYRISASTGKEKKRKHKTRTDSEDQQGQIVSWKAEAIQDIITKLIKKVFPEVKKEVPLTLAETISKKIQEAYIKEWQRTSKNLSTKRKKRIMEDYNLHIAKKYGTYVAPVINFRFAQDSKSKGAMVRPVNAIITSELTTFLKLKAGSKKVEDLSKKIGTAINIGHGTQGSFSVAQKKAMQMKRVADNKINDDDSLTKAEKQNARAQVNKVFREAANVFREENDKTVKTQDKLTTKMIWQRVFTETGEYKENFVQVLTFEDGEINQDKGRTIEAAYARNIISLSKALVEAPGSLSTLQAMESAILKSLTENLTKGSFKLLGSGKHILRPRYSKDSRRTQRKIKAKIEKKVKSARMNPVTALSPISLKKIIAIKPKSRSGAKKSKGQNLAQLQAILNVKLPDTVKDNMGKPGLVNRTGRFAQSVNVTDISTTAKGFPSVGYTYQKNPYQKFEKDSISQRDPRLVINQSIREIMMEQMEGRFFTRRV
jgi:hypothetical protein